MQRIHSIDVLKLIIAAGVVWAHATLLTLQGGALSYVFGQGLVRTVVPTFAVISGFLFHSTFHHGRARGWLIRLAAFYLLWSVIYLPIWGPESPTLTAALVEMVFGPMHLWYMAALMVALVMIRLVLGLAGHGRRGRIWLLATALFCLLSGTALQSWIFFAGGDLSIHVWRNGVFFEYPFAVMGYLVADRIQTHGWDWLPSAGLAWTGVLVFSGLRLVEAGIGLHLYGLSIIAPPEFPLLAVAFSLSVLLAALKTDMPKAPINLAYLSMMIYFLHLGILLVILHFGISNALALTALSIVLSALAAMVLLEVGKWLAGRLPISVQLRLFGRDRLRDGGREGEPSAERI